MKISSGEERLTAIICLTGTGGLIIVFVLLWAFSAAPSANHAKETTNDLHKVVNGGTDETRKDLDKTTNDRTDETKDDLDKTMNDHAKEIMKDLEKRTHFGCSHFKFFCNLGCRHKTSANRCEAENNYATKVTKFKSTTTCKCLGSQWLYTGACLRVEIADHLQKQEEFNADALRAHNDYRERHGVDPYVRNKKLEKSALLSAERMADQDNMAHEAREVIKQNSGLYATENILMSTTPVSGVYATQMWYDEICQYGTSGFTEEGTIHPYDFNWDTYEELKKRSGLKYGHFIPVVSDLGKQIGCGIAMNPKGKVYAACHYSPYAFLKSGYQEYVLPPKQWDDDWCYDPCNVYLHK